MIVKKIRGSLQRSWAWIRARPYEFLGIRVRCTLSFSKTSKIHNPWKMCDVPNPHNLITKKKQIYGTIKKLRRRFLSLWWSRVRVSFTVFFNCYFSTELHTYMSRQENEVILRRMKKSWEKNLPDLNEYVDHILPLLRNSSKENGEFFFLFNYN